MALIKQRIMQGVKETAVMEIDRCVCRCIQVFRPFAHHSCPWNEAQTASCQYRRRSVQWGSDWPVSCGFGGGAV